jgi:hypothetical protein
VWSVRELTSWNGGGTDTIDYISGFITQIEPWEVRGAENMGVFYIRPLTLSSSFCVGHE